MWDLKEKTMIKIKQLSKAFNEDYVIKNFSEEIKENEMIAIVGKSGCGKSTLLNILGLIDSEYDGQILYDDIDIKKLNASSKNTFVRTNISYLFQNYALIDDETVYENLLLALYYTKLKKEEKKQFIMNALKKVELVDKLNKQVFTLSGGEQQRVALARTLLKPCKIILADEPTGNLDNNNRDQVIKILKEMHNDKKTVIIVTHDETIAKQCQRKISLEKV